jgi:hypothetical protein
LVAGITCTRAILAVLSTPQRILSIDQLLQKSTD